MVVSIPSVIVFLIIGALAGWLAGLIVHGHGFGLVGNVVVGVIGALIGGFVLRALGVLLIGGFLAGLVGATIGAVVLLVIIGLFRQA